MNECFIREKKNLELSIHSFQSVHLWFLIQKVLKRKGQLLQHYQSNSDEQQVLWSEMESSVILMFYLYRYRSSRIHCCKEQQYAW